MEGAGCAQHPQAPPIVDFSIFLTVAPLSALGLELLSAVQEGGRSGLSDTAFHDWLGSLKSSSVPPPFSFLASQRADKAAASCTGKRPLEASVELLLERWRAAECCLLLPHVTLGLLP